VLGVDGFVLVPDGFVADLDLVLDVSGPDLSVKEAAMDAEAAAESIQICAEPRFGKRR